ncbi:hypothetical protein WJX79_006184 [Trebouxia sp. C0005]
MPLVLMQANGACIHLTPDKGFRLGRQQVAPSFGGAAHVSRVQCEVSSVPSGRQACLLLTSKSKHNPTGVQLGIQRADHKQVVRLLNEGESTQMHVGDRILLQANQLDQFLEVVESAETSSARTAQPPPQKRQRLSWPHDIGSTGNQASPSPSNSGELLSMSQASTDAEGLHCEAHAVVLGLPAKVCAGRAAARVDHEGGVQGPSAPRVVHMMHSQLIKAGPPTKAEGLSSIMVCRSDQDVKSALQAWCAYGQPGSTPADMFKQANPLRQAFASSAGKAVPTVDGGSGHKTQHGQVSGHKDGTEQQEAADALSSVGSEPRAGASWGGSGVQAGWQGALQRIAAHPERHTKQYPEMQIYDDCVVINDAFPKARCHALVIVRQEGLDGPADLRPEHLPLLRSMQAAAEHSICTSSARILRQLH